MQRIVIVVSGGVVQEIYATDPKVVRVILREYDDKEAGDKNWVREFPAVQVTEEDEREFAREEGKEVNN